MSLKKVLKKMDAVQQENNQRKYIPGSHDPVHHYRLENE